MKTMQRKLMGLILAAAAYGVYRYIKMTPEQRNELKNKGKEFLNKNMNMGRTYDTVEASRANSY